MLERTLESRLKTLVKQAGGIAYKLDSRTHKGAPDRVVLMPGQPPIFVELKTMTGRLSPMQHLEIERIRSAGGQVAVLYGLGAITTFVEGMRRAA
jgi:hypothetical protein